tara:strand:- start:2785 stop:3000 length:216 start_codon:yes stop_codon:yes gene_type:complete
MNSKLKNICEYLEISTEFDLNQPITEHEDYDSLFHLDLITYLEKEFKIEIDDQKTFLNNKSFIDLIKIIDD